MSRTCPASNAIAFTTRSGRNCSTTPAPSRPCNCTVRSPSRSAVSFTAAGGSSANSPTGSTNAGSDRTIRSASSGRMYRGDFRTNTSPTASAPASAAAIAVSRSRTPQILIRVRIALIHPLAA